MRNFLIFSLIAVFLFTFLAISQAELGEGVSKKEAILIAKEFLQKNGLENDYYLDKHKVKLKNGVWYVAFPRRQKVKTFFNVAVSTMVKIDQTTGKILEHIFQKGYCIP